MGVRATGTSLRDPDDDYSYQIAVGDLERLSQGVTANENAIAANADSISTNTAAIAAITGGFSGAVNGSSTSDTVSLALPSSPSSGSKYVVQVNHYTAEVNGGSTWQSHLGICVFLSFSTSWSVTFCGYANQWDSAVATNYAIIPFTGTATVADGGSTTIASFFDSSWSLTLNGTAISVTRVPKTGYSVSSAKAGIMAVYQ